MWNGVAPAQWCHSEQDEKTTDEKILAVVKGFARPDDPRFSDYYELVDGEAKLSERVAEFRLGDLTGEEQAQLLAILGSARYDAMKADGVGGAILDISGTLADFATNVNKLEAVCGRSEAMRHVLEYLAASTDNEDLKWACYDLIVRMEQEFSVERVLASEILQYGFDALIDTLCENVTLGAYADLGGPWAAINVGYKIVDRFVSAEDQYEAYRRMLVLDDICAATDAARSEIWGRYVSNRSSEDAALVGSLGDLLMGEYIVGYELTSAFIEANQENPVAQYLEIYYRGEAVNDSTVIVDAACARLRKGYERANMVLADVCNQDGAFHVAQMAGANVTIEDQHELDDWVSLTGDAEDLVGRRTIIRTDLAPAMPYLTVRTTTRLADVEAWCRLVFADDASLDVHGNLIVHGAYYPADGEDVWVDGIIELAANNRLNVTGNVDIEGLIMDDAQDRVTIGGDLAVCGCGGDEDYQGMTAGRIELGGNIILGAGLEHDCDWGFLPTGSCVLAFVGDGDHTVTGSGTPLKNLGNVEIKDVRFDFNSMAMSVAGISMRLMDDAIIADAEYANDTISLEALDLNGHSLTMPGWLVVKGLTGARESVITASYVTVKEGLHLGEDESLTINARIDKGYSGLDAPYVTLDGGRLTVNHNLRLEGASTDVSVISAGGLLQCSGELWSVQPLVLRGAAQVSVAGKAELHGVSMVESGDTDGDGLSDDAAGSDGEPLLAVRGDLDDGGFDEAVAQGNGVKAGNVRAYGDVYLRNGKALAPEAGGVLELRGTGKQKIHLFDDYALGRLGVWNANVVFLRDWAELGRDEWPSLQIVAGDLALATMRLPSSKTYTYTGKAQRPAPASVELLGQKLGPGAYTLSYANNVKAGTARVVATGVGGFEGKATATFKIARAAATIKAKKATVAVKAKTVAKKKVTLASNVGAKTDGTLTYTNVSKSRAAKKLAVNKKTGKVTIPKKTKKGTYTIKIKVVAKRGTNYQALTKTVTYKIRVK